MRLHRLFCCALLFAFILCIIFSVTVSAADVNGFEVNTYLNKGPGVNTPFTSTIIQDFSSNSLDIVADVIFPESIKEDSIFDFRLLFNSGYYSSISASYSLYTDTGLLLTDGTCYISNQSVIIDDVIVDGGDAAKLTIYFNINNPLWNENITEEPEPEEPPGTIMRMTFYYAADDGSATYYSYEEGMTWRDWINSSYNVLGNFTYDNQNRVITSPNNNFVYRYLYHTFHNQGYVYLDDRILFVNEVDADGSFYADYNISINSITEYTFDFSIVDVSNDIIEPTEENKGIIGWIKNIINSIKSLPSMIANTLKTLYVPSEEDILAFKDKFTQLLDDRFGAIYDSAQIIDDFANVFIDESQSSIGGSGTVSFPSVSVNLAGVDFTFGGWEVDPVPDSFESIVDVLKTIANIVCTFAFINAMKRKLESILR